MYGLSTDSDVTIKNLGAGKHENVTLVKISKEPLSSKDPESQIVLKFYLEKDGYSLSPAEFPINEERILAWANANAETVKKEYKYQESRIFHILGTFIPNAKLVIPQTASWEDYLDALVALAGEAFVGESFRCKLVYRGKNVGFPKLAWKPFFQNMKEPDGITIDPQWDNIIPPVPEGEEDIKKEDAF
jgi:hypothetical protein